MKRLYKHKSFTVRRDPHLLWRYLSICIIYLSFCLPFIHYLPFLLAQILSFTLTHYITFSYFHTKCDGNRDNSESYMIHQFVCLFFNKGYTNNTSEHVFQVCKFTVAHLWWQLQAKHLRSWNSQMLVNEQLIFMWKFWCVVILILWSMCCNIDTRLNITI